MKTIMSLEQLNTFDDVCYFLDGTQTSLTVVKVAQLEVKYAEAKLLVQAYIESYVY
jgi:hypothetical protein